MDRIHIRDLLLRCILGITDEERKDKQDVLINVTLFADLKRAGITDLIENSVDYSSVKKSIIRIVENSSFRLLEALAEAIAMACLGYQGIDKAIVSVDKPGALRFARSVAVEIERKLQVPARAFISMGSNINPEENIQKALGLLKEKVSVISISTFYRTPPLGRPEQKDFVNGVVEIETSILPFDLKISVLRKIEDKLGRIRTEDKFASRSIDMDLLIYEGLIIDTNSITIPDPDITYRPFLAIPLAEIAPDRLLPGTSRSIKEIAGKFSKNSMTPLLDFTKALREDVL